jgi:phenylpropionate dioxygenase-like ring-hydroxylating dioxygenase large terminal subunit
MYLKNAWYIAAWSNELGDALLGREICEQAVLLYRKENGDAVAIGGLCPHRFAPLHMGKRVGDTVQCGYHGMVFGENGQCVRNPHHGGVVSPGMKVSVYPVVERYNAIWLWMGDAASADPALIPDFSCYGAAGFETIFGMMDVAANYELITDNLLDLTHGEFLHEGLLSSEAITISKLETLESGSTLWSNRWCPDDVAPPVWGQIIASQMGTDISEHVDHWLYMRWDAPAQMLLDVGITPKGKTRDDGIWVYAGHHITPVTPTRSLYFWAISRNHGVGDPDVNAFWQMSIDAAFVGQDQPMIEAQQAAIGNQPIEALKPVAIPADVAGGKARRTLQRLIAAEASGERPTPRAEPLTILLARCGASREPVLPVV